MSAGLMRWFVSTSFGNLYPLTFYFKTTQIIVFLLIGNTFINTVNSIQEKYSDIKYKIFNIKFLYILIYRFIYSDIDLYIDLYIWYRFMYSDIIFKIFFKYSGLWIGLFGTLLASCFGTLALWTLATLTLKFESFNVVSVDFKCMQCFCTVSRVKDCSN